MKAHLRTGIGVLLMIGAIVFWIIFLNGPLMYMFMAIVCAVLGIGALEYPPPSLVEPRTHALDIHSTAAQLSEEFGVPVQADSVLADGRTVGDVIRYVCHLLNAEDDGETDYVPLQRLAEDAVREALSTALGLPPDAITMDTALGSVLPHGRKRRAPWRAIRRTLNPLIDPLETPRERTSLPGCAAILLAIGIMVAAFSISAFRTALSPIAFAVVVVGLAIAVPTFLFVRLKRARASVIPWRYQTVGDLVPDAAQRIKLGQDNTRPASWCRNEVALRTREILSINARLTLRKVTADKILGKDIRTA